MIRIYIIVRHLFKGTMKKWQMLMLIHLAITIRQTRILMKVKIFLLRQEERWEEDPLGNHNKNKKHCLEAEQVLREKFSF